MSDIVICNVPEDVEYTCCKNIKFTIGKDKKIDLIFGNDSIDVEDLIKTVKKLENKVKELEDKVVLMYYAPPNRGGPGYQDGLNSILDLNKNMDKN